jgi:hypothetical protein
MTTPGRVEPPRTGKPCTNVSELAARQQGIVTVGELRACGETIQVTTPMTERRRHPGLTVHRTNTLERTLHKPTRNEPEDAVHETHDHALARHDDAVRRRRLERAGYRVVRVTWRQAVLRPAQTRARLRAEASRCPAAAAPQTSASSGSSLPRAA